MSELQQPFGLTPSGGVAVVSDPGTISQQHLQALVSTAPGERVMQPRYGVPAASYLFGVDAAAADALLASDIGAAILAWEPSVALQDVQTSISDTTLGIAAINVMYTPGAGVSPQAQAQTATVLVGGGVVG
jgi:phage baseplate assembly protein W